MSFTVNLSSVSYTHLDVYKRQVDGKGDIGKDSILQITHDMCKTADKKLYVIDMNNPNTSSKYNTFINSLSLINI